MEINRPAIAGTLESSDAQVTVEPGEGCIELQGKRANKARKLVKELLEEGSEPNDKVNKSKTCSKQ